MTRVVISVIAEVTGRPERGQAGVAQLPSRCGHQAPAGRRAQCDGAQWRSGQRPGPESGHLQLPGAVSHLPLQAWQHDLLPSPLLCPGGQDQAGDTPQLWWQTFDCSDSGHTLWVSAEQERSECGHQALPLEQLPRAQVPQPHLRGCGHSVCPRHSPPGVLERLPTPRPPVQPGGHQTRGGGHLPPGLQQAQSVPAGVSVHPPAPRYVPVQH